MADIKIRTLDDLRSWYGDEGKGLSDEQMMSGFAKVTGASPTQIANQFGYDPGTGSKTRERVSSSVDDYQSNLYGVLGAATRAVGGTGEWADRKRDSNKFQADVASGRAKNLGAVDSYKDVGGVADAGDYVAGLAIDSAPAMLEMGAAALTGGAAGALSMAGRGATAVSRASRIGGAVGAAAGDYPVAVGDILANQREAGGENLGSAMLGGIPYVAVDVGTGVGKFIAKGSLPRNTVNLLDNITGAKGVAARTAATGGRLALEEGLGETAQEVINQYSGRMAVDPNAGLLDADAIERYKESFVGGATLGGVLGGAAGGWRRSHPNEQPKPTVDEQPDLLARGLPDPNQLRIPNTGLSTMVTFPDGTTAVGSDQELMHRFNLTPQMLARLSGREVLTPAEQAAHALGPMEPNPDNVITDNARGPEPATPVAPQGTIQLGDAPQSSTAQPGGTLTDRAAVEAAAREFAGRRQHASDMLVDKDEKTGKPAIQVPPQVVQLHHDMVNLVQSGKMEAAQYTAFAGAIKEALRTEDRKAIAAVRKEVEAIKNPKPVKDAGERAAPSGAAAVAQPAVAGRSDLAGGSVGDVGTVAQPQAGRVDGPAGSPAVDGGPAGAVELGRGGESPALAFIDGQAVPAPTATATVVKKKGKLTPKPIAAPAAAPAPAAAAPVTPGKFKKAPKPGEKPAVAATRSTVTAPAAATFNNVADLVDALVAENKLDPKVGQAYMLYRDSGSHAKVGKELGIGKSTAGDYVRQMKALVDQASLLRLSGSAPDVATDVEHLPDPGEEVQEAPAPGQEVESAAEDDGELGEEANTGGTLKKSGDLVDEANRSIDTGEDNELQGLHITDNMNGEAETQANNDREAEKAYKAQRKMPDSTLKTRWDSLTADVPKKSDRVEFSKLGEGSKLFFEQALNGEHGGAKSVHTRLSKATKEGVKFNEDGLTASGLRGLEEGEGAGAHDVVHAAWRDVVKQIHKLWPGIKGFGQTTIATEDSRGTRMIFRSMRPAEENAVIAALYNLMQSEASSLLMRAGDTLQHIYVYSQGTSMAQYFPEQRALALHTRNFDRMGGKFDPEIALSILHEVVHHADFETGVAAESTRYDSAPTLARADYIFDRADPTKTEVRVKLGPVAQEAFDLYKKVASPDLAHPFDQAMWALKAQLDKLESRGNRLGLAQESMIDKIMDTAATELTPKLAELWASNNPLLDSLPLGKAYIAKLMSASTWSDIEATLQGKTNDQVDERADQVHEADATDGTNPDDDSGAASAREAGDRGVHGDVRRGAEAAAGNVDDGVRGADRQVGQGGQDRARNSDGHKAREADVNKSAPVEPPQLGAKLSSWFKSLTGDKLYRNHPGLLGWLSTEQLGTSFSKQPAVEAFSKSMQRMGGAASQMMHVSDDISRGWNDLKKKLGAESAAAFDELLNRSTRSQIWPDRPLSDPAQDHLDRSDAKVQAEHAVLAAQWARLPKAYQDLFASTQKDHKTRFERYVAAQRQLIIRTFYPGADATGVPSRELIDAAARLPAAERDTFLEQNGTTKAEADTYRSLWEGLTAQQKISRLIGPYAPQARFGDHIVSFKGKEYLEAERALTAATNQLQGLNKSEHRTALDALDAEISSLKARLKRAGTEGRKATIRQDLVEAQADRDAAADKFDKAKALVASRTDELNALKADRNSYSVEFFENRGQATAREAQLKEFFGDDGTEVKRSLRDQWIKQHDAITPEYMKRIENHLTSNLAGRDAEEIKRTVREMYLQHLPGTSALKSQIKRKNVPGIKDAEASRSFANKAMRDAYAISRLEHSGDLHEHLETLRNGDNEDSRILANELGQRMAQNFTIKTNRLIQAATNLTYFSQLGLSPSFMLMQGTQQWVITAPIMAARHGIAAATTGLAKGTADAAKLLKVSFDGAKTKMNFQVDIPAAIKAGIITEQEGRVLKDMFDRGRIDITTSHDLGIANNPSATDPLSRAAQMSNWPVQQLETINRVSTALAGYRAERAALVGGGKSVAEAEQRAAAYADKLVSETHMNYNSENRARFMHPSNWGGWGRIMFQFRAYQQGMAYLTIRNMVDAARGDKQAMKAVGYLAGVQLAVAGTAGLPIPGAMVAVAAYLYKKWNDDEDRDLKEMFFQGMKSVGGEDFARAVTGGLPAAAGVNLSQKVGMGNVFDLAPFVPHKNDMKDQTAAYWMALTAGPAGGQVANYLNAVAFANDGEWGKAAAATLPKFAADPLRAFAYETKGTQDKRGNTILTPDDISTFTSTLRALGLESEDMRRTQDQRSAYLEAKHSRTEMRAKLLTDYARLRLAGEDTSDVDMKIAEFNDRHADTRIAPGQKMIAVSKRRDAEKNMHNGISVGKRDKALAADVGVE